MRRKICIIAGPTAVGKTDVSLLLAKSLYGEIISADSAQVYKYMDIGTAKLKPNEMDNIKHYMIDEVFPNEPFSVAEFRQRCEKYIEQITTIGKLPIIVGGTGLYINSLLNNLDFTPTVCDENFRKEMETLAQNKGNSYVHSLLKEIDMKSYIKLHPNDIRRVIRALEVYRCTKKPISYYQEQSKLIPPKYDFAYIGLTMDRNNLYERINRRVDYMINKGLIDEVKLLLSKGYSRNLVSMQAIGYKEIAAHINNECTLEEAIELIKKNSRNYAKRQLTWFRNDNRVFWLYTDNFFSRKILVENIIRYVAGKIGLI